MVCLCNVLIKYVENAGSSLEYIAKYQSKMNTIVLVGLGIAMMRQFVLKLALI